MIHNHEVESSSLSLATRFKRFRTSVLKRFFVTGYDLTGKEPPFPRGFVPVPGLVERGVQA